MTMFLCLPAVAMTILIDPGHGGEDEGAVAHFIQNGKNVTIKEKDLTLAISEHLYELLRAKHTVFLTRSFDRTLSLKERAIIADKVKADLFISIHINSSADQSVHGLETYYLDNSDDWAVKKVEKTENILGKEDDVVQQILVDLVIEKTVEISKPLAMSIHQKLKQDLVNFKVHNRGVKPGLFYVLALSKRPGVLLEAGFISNAKDRKLILNPKYQKAYARSVALSLESFVKKKKK